MIESNRFREKYAHNGKLIYKNRPTIMMTNKNLKSEVAQLRAKCIKYNDKRRNSSFFKRIYFKRVKRENMDVDDVIMIHNAQSISIVRNH